MIDQASCCNELLKNNLRFQMWNLFSIYPELSLSDLSQKLNKCKSTLHPHVKTLLEFGLIEEVREEHKRGNIKAKIYARTPKSTDQQFVREKLEINSKIVSLDKESGRKYLVQLLARTKLLKKSIDSQLSFIEKLLNSGRNGPDEHALQLLNEMLIKNTMDNNSGSPGPDIFEYCTYLSKNAYCSYRKKLEQINRELKEVIKKEETLNPTIEKPFYFFGIGLPLKKMCSYMNPPKNY
ncbi:hypothetical protein NEF87_001528 [Candidatus Lokiarchaeum ossiferum]|uniref:HTH arsR-type domain-containing protein n=1 Tax=Candidatus Lokiarchaeum ossiferum TaxID=2951803 RepID=A0ABY6HPI4_9ARCH|nr:hypothetical protein NEF87_001528 [Candidatus Lokiarchaeum sp. B-35]